MRSHVEAARKLLEFAQASARGSDYGEHAAAVGLIYERIFQAFAPIIGAAGIHALFARSVKLSEVDHPGLGNIIVMDLPLEKNVQMIRQVMGVLNQLEREPAIEMAINLYAMFLRLTTKFIGAKLTWQIMKKAFPAFDATCWEESE